MPATAMIHVRVEESVKQQATSALESMGLTVSGAVNMFLTRVAVEQAIPFAIRVPNAVTREAIDEANSLAAGGGSRFLDAESLMDALEAPGE